MKHFERSSRDWESLPSVTPHVTSGVSFAQASSFQLSEHDATFEFPFALSMTKKTNHVTATDHVI